MKRPLLLAPVRTLLLAAATAAPLCVAASTTWAQEPGGNPIIRDRFTADPAPLVVGDTLYLYVGHDEAKGKEMFTMREWRCYSTKDMKTWTDHGAILRPTDFKWAERDAWAAQMVERNGKFYFFVTTQHARPGGGKAIGVAVSDSPTGPFVDARGSALVTDSMTPSLNAWDDIDPTVMIDDDGTAWLAWGNPNCYLAKLKPNLIEIDGPIQQLFVPNYTEGPWLHRRNGLYYLTYAAFAHQGFSERICYATATSMAGPWTYRGVLTGAAKNSYTIHPGIVDFKGRSYFFYHYAGLTLPDGQTGGLGRRAVCVEFLHYNPDGTIQPIAQTEAGVTAPPTPKPPAPTTSDTGRPERGVRLAAGAAPNAPQWPGKPALVTTDRPQREAIRPEGFNRSGGTTSIGQTFVLDRDIRLGRLAIYAGDGFPTTSDSPLTLGLYDLGPSDAEVPARYEAGANLLGSGDGLQLTYDVQAPGILEVEFDEPNQVSLKAGRRYVLELQGKKNAPTAYWRRTATDSYAGGAAFSGRALISDKDGKQGDFAMAIYGTDAGR